jgi:hypothetical protein
MKRGITVLASVGALFSVGYFTAVKWAIRNETLTSYDASPDDRPVAVDVRRIDSVSFIATQFGARKVSNLGRIDDADDMTNLVQCARNA